MNNNSELFIDNNVIAKVHYSSTFLGIIIDEKLKWQEHIMQWQIKQVNL